MSRGNGNNRGRNNNRPRPPKAPAPPAKLDHTKSLTIMYFDRGHLETILIALKVSAHQAQSQQSLEPGVLRFRRENAQLLPMIEGALLQGAAACACPPCLEVLAEYKTTPEEVLAKAKAAAAGLSPAPNAFKPVN